MSLRAVCLLAITVIASIAVAAEWTPVAVPTRQPLAGTAPVWLRCCIRVPDEITSRAEKELWSDSNTLSLGGIGGPVSVRLNGTKGVLQFNVLALRLEGRERFDAKTQIKNGA